MIVQTMKLITIRMMVKVGMIKTGTYSDSDNASGEDLNDTNDGENDIDSDNDGL